MKILIVDDEALARRRLASLLADCPANPPHRVSEAASSADALALLAPVDGRGFDLLLLDIHMPGLDSLSGLAKVKRLREMATRTPPAAESLGEVLLIQDRGRTERVPLTEVLLCKAELKYVTLRTASRSYVLDSTLAELEARHGAQLMRVHRNALVARHAVRALEKHFDAEEGDCWAVRLAGLAEPIMVSRRQVAAVREEIAHG